MKMQTVLDLLVKAQQQTASAFALVKQAADQAAADVNKGESAKDAHARIYGEYVVDMPGPDWANVRAHFSACLLVALAPAGTMIETKAATGKAAAVTAPVSEMVTQREVIKAAAQLREDLGFASSGRKGKTGARTPAPAVNSGAMAGPLFPGVSTAAPAAPAAPVPLADRWDDFGADLLVALADEGMRAKLGAILLRAGFTVKPSRVVAKAAVTKPVPVPPADVLKGAVDVQDKRVAH